MKKFTLLAAVLLAVHFSFGQATLIVEAPLNNNTAGANRAPNGTLGHSFLRACYLVPQPELYNIPTGTSISSFGYTLSTGTTGMAVTGNFTVYLENTSDVTYQKGTVFSSIIAPMANAYANVMTIPVSATTTSVIVTLSTPFVYTGGGLYVAYDWASAGPFVTEGATYLGETTALPLPGGGGGVAYSNATAPSTIAITNSRPSFLFGFTNPHTNDIQVIGIEAPGKVAATLSAPHIIRAYVKNASNQAQTNIAVNLNVTGANAFTNSQTIPSLAAGAGILVSFAAFNPVTLGLNTISVSVNNDQNNLNNSATYSQSVTCNQWAQNPPAGTFTTNSVGFNTGAGIIVTSYVSPANSLLAGVRGAISANLPTVNQQLCGVLLNAAGGIIATTNSITVTNGMLGTFQDFTFSSSQALTAGTTYYIGFAQINPGAIAFFPAGTLSSYYIPANMYSFTGIAGGALTILAQNFGYFGIEAVFDSNVNLNISSTPTAVCLGSCASLSVTGLNTYTWSTGLSGSSITVCPTVTTTYSVTGTTTLGCPSSAVVSVMTNQLPVISIMADDLSVCAGTAVSFTANGASSYTWNTGATTATNVLIPAASNIYTVVGINGNGCVNTGTVDVTVFTLSVTVSSNTTVCKGKSTTLVANGSQPYTYMWLPSHPFASYAVTPSVTTTYTVNATDGNGCVLSNTVTVGVDNNPTVTAAPDRSVICRGESTILRAFGAATYSWVNSGNASGNATITVSPAIATTTNYVVIGANNAGCTHTAAVSLVVNACVGIHENSAGLPLQVFPNPNNGLFYITADGFPQNGRIEVYSSLGTLIKTQTTGTGTFLQIDLGQEPNGVYFIRLFDQAGPVHTARIVKQ